MGSNHGPDPHGARRGHAGRAHPRRAARGRREPRPAAHPRARHPARALRRGRRGRPAPLAGPPAAVGLRARAPARRRCARPARWSTCSATTRASRSGARTTSRSRSTSNPASAIRARDVARPRSSMFLPSWNKDVLDRSIARALHKADPTRAGRTRTRACSPASAAAAPTRTSTSAGTTGGWTASRRRAARDAAAGPLRHRVRCAGRARHRGLHGPRALARPRLGRPLRAPRAARSATSTSTSRPRCFDSFAAWRDATQHYQAALDPAADRGPPPAQARPDRRVLPLLLRRRSSRGHVVGARPRARAQGRLRTRCATRAAPCCRCSSPAAASVHVVNEAADRLDGAVVEADVDGRAAAPGPATSRPTRSCTSAASTCPSTRSTSPCTLRHPGAR